MHPPGALDQNGIAGLQKIREPLEQFVLGQEAQTFHGLIKQGPDAYDHVDSKTYRFLSDPYMESGRLVTQFQHIAQDAYLPPACPRKDLQRRLHGGGVGVVNVVQKGETI